jgi:hypothetical protein
MRRMSPFRPNEERGAVLVLTVGFAVVMVMMAALVIDIGALHDEKRQLQNGADAAALGLAEILFKNCPNGPQAGACTQGRLQTAADILVNDNSLDAASDAVVLSPDFAKQEITVKTSTKSNDGGTILPFFFAKAFTGESGKTVHAQATATWSGLKRATVIPLTIDKCEFTSATTGGSVFGQPTVIGFHDGNAFSKADCTPSKPKKSGLDLPGGYGWVEDEDSEPGDCNVTPTVGEELKADTGLPGTPHACDLSKLLDTDILVPIFVGATGSGANGRYPLQGFGQFHLTGFYFSNKDKGSISGMALPCGPPATCIGGYFVKFVPVGEFGGPINLGQRPALVK